jgi:hypothetical protein
MLFACEFDKLCSTTLRPPEDLLPLPLATITAATAAVVLALHALLPAAAAAARVC